MSTTATAQPRSETFRLPKHKRHVPDARAQVRKILADWGVDAELAADAVTVAVEYVTNAVRHCRVTFAQIQVTLSDRDGALLVEVCDPDNVRVPARRTSGEQDEGGRGLAIVASLAEDWGYELRPLSKCVWATFPLPEPSSTAPTPLSRVRS
ncbi:putative anti-sigma regulatory factor, serine/threonine protein kinase [Actinobacteria bacterium OK074]|nr:putative anti-sigma regulatory factor, serine/threonine protein kinase [Actinobacteria bacterium OK074]